MKISNRIRTIAVAVMIAAFVAVAAIKVSAQSGVFAINQICPDVGLACIQTSGTGAPTNNPSTTFTWSLDTDGHIYFWNGSTWTLKV
jgi:hypothetical protein